MQEDEVVLSDVHLQVKSNQGKDNYHISRFYYTEALSDHRKKWKFTSEKKFKCHHNIDKDSGDTSNETQQATLTDNHGYDVVNSDDNKDTDGDLELNRRKRRVVNTSVITLGYHGGDHRLQKATFTGNHGDDLINSDVNQDSDGDLELNRRKRRVDTASIITFGNHGDDFVTSYDNKDADGDVELKRRKRKLDTASVRTLGNLGDDVLTTDDNRDTISVLTIAHKLETSLGNVGLQIWLASLYMADFIISNRKVFQGKKVLDLGAGVGLTSVVAAMYAEHVTCTDTGKDILELAQHNLDSNNNKDITNFTVEELDWFDNKFITVSRESCQSLCEDNITMCDTAISADVIYDDDITDALFRTVYGLMMNTNLKTWYISLERRYVFTVKDLDIACPAYQHFRECLNQLEELVDDIQFRVTLMDEFTQSFQYTRTKQLELWKVTAYRKEGPT